MWYAFGWTFAFSFKQKNSKKLCEFDNLLKKLLGLFSAKLIFKAWQHMLTLAISAVSVHLMHFVCLRRKFTVWWLNMSKCSTVSPVLIVTPTSLSSTSYLCIRCRRVSITVRICCTSAKDHTLFFKTFQVSEAFFIN